MEMQFFMDKKTTNRSNCPVSCFLDILGDKWTLLIVRDMIFYGKNSYHEFFASPEKIAANTLIFRLKQLETQGIISVIGDQCSGETYKLTEKGIRLLPVLIEICFWSDKYFDIAEMYRTQIKVFKKTVLNL
jgi:DNA-binding HxlR family transcriptional regulator